MSRFTPCLALPVLLLAAGGSVAAQVTTATIYGRILDSSGASVAGAKVTATNQGTNAAATTTSDAEGFTFTFLPAGSYSLSVEANGFKPVRQTNLQLGAGQRVGIDITLEVGAVSEAIEVSSSAPLVNTVSAEQREDKSQLQLRELPLARRDWTNIINIGTGVTPQGLGVTMNGLPPTGFRLTVDGTDAEGDPEVPSLGMAQNFNQIKTISLEAVSEVNVVKGIPSAEIANTMSGNINIISKSGTNEFHGSLFLNNQVEDLAARSQFATTRGPLVFNQFGGSAGGPVVKDKLFFFGVYEGYRQRAFRVITGNIPTREFRDQAVAAVPAYKSFFDLYPLPTAPSPAGAVTAFHVANASNAGSDNHAVSRVDYRAKDDLAFGFRYTRGRPYANNPNISPQNAQVYSGIAEAGSANVIYSRPSFISETRIGVNHNEVARVDGIYELKVTGITGNLGFGLGGESLFRSGETISFEEVLAKTHGRHNIKFGGIYMFRNVRRDNEEMAQLQYANTADFFANIPSTIRVTWGVKPFLMRQWQIGAFLQDDIRVNRRLVVNIGVRYDYHSVPTERDGRLFNLTDLGYGPLRPADSIYNADYVNFSPRLSFSYTLDQNAHTVIRGGTGVFVNPRNMLGGPTEIVQNAIDEPFRRIFSRAEALQFPQLRFPVVNANVLPLVKGQTVAPSTVINANFPNPYSMQWSLGVQRQITSAFALETGYVGTRGVKLNMVRDYNRVDRITGQRLNPAIGQIRYYDGSESSHYHSWQTSLRKRYSSGLLFNVHHTWGSTISYNDGDLVLPQQRPQDNDNLALEKGPAPFDIRHRFASDVLYELPLARLSGSTSRLSRVALAGWQIGGIFNALSGSPFTVGNPSSIAGQRVDFVGGSPYAASPRETLVFLNTRAFAEVPLSTASGAPIRPGSLGRGALRLPGFWNADLALSKGFSFTERWKLQLRADMLNAFNHTNFSAVSTNTRANNFGSFTGTRGARVVQLNARVTF